MNQYRIYELTDPDLPAELHLVKRVFLLPSFGQKPTLAQRQLSEYQKARIAAAKARQYLEDRRNKKEQLTLKVR